VFSKKVCSTNNDTFRKKTVFKMSTLFILLNDV